MRKKTEQEIEIEIENGFIIMLYLHALNLFKRDLLRSFAFERLQHFIIIIYTRKQAIEIHTKRVN